MLAARDLIALRVLAGLSRSEMAVKLRLKYQQLLAYEQPEQAIGFSLALKWLWYCRLTTLPYFFRCCWQPEKLLEAADPQLVKYLQNRKLFLLQSFCYLVSLYLIYLLLLQYFDFSPWTAFTYIYLVVCVLVMAINKADVNITSLLVLLLLFRIVEVTVFPQLKMNIYLPQLFYFCIDALVTTLIAFRPAICRLITKGLNKPSQNDRFYVTQADMLVGAIYILYLPVSILMIGEHLLRHLDHIGLPYNAWLNQHARVIWSNHANIKFPLNLLEFVALLTTINWRLVKYRA